MSLPVDTPGSQDEAAKVLPFVLPTYSDPIPGIINYGSVNILAGASGVGKTCFLSWLLTQLRDGKPVFGKPVNVPTTIGYVAADRGWEAGGRYWFDKSGLEVKVYSLADDPNFIPVRLRNKLKLVSDVLKHCLDRLDLPAGSLVAIDPIALFIGNLNDYHATATALLEIRRLCADRKLSAIGLAHAAKQKADKKERYMRLQDRINGSGAQLGYGDTQMYLAGPDETGKRHYTFLWHPHNAPAQEFQLGRSPEGLFIPWSASLDSVNDALIYEAIPEDGSAIAMATILGLTSAISRATVNRRLHELIIEGLIEKPMEGWYRRTNTSAYPAPHPADKEPNHEH